MTQVIGENKYWKDDAQRFEGILKTLWYESVEVDHWDRIKQGDIDLIVDATASMHIAQLPLFLKQVPGFLSEKRLQACDHHLTEFCFLHQGLISGVVSAVNYFEEEFVEKPNEKLEESIAEFIVATLHHQMELNCRDICYEYENDLDRYLSPRLGKGIETLKKTRHGFLLRELRKKKFPNPTCSVAWALKMITTSLFSTFGFDLQTTLIENGRKAVMKAR